MDVLEYIYFNGEKRVEPLPLNDTKTDVSGYYKAPSGAVISKDREALQQYKLRKKKNGELNNMKYELQELKKDINEIKLLLRGLSKIDGNS